MHQRSYIAIAFVLAGMATITGLSQTLAHKTFPAAKLAFWFPLTVITENYGNVFSVVLALVQFFLFALLFAIGIRRWNAFIMSAAIGFMYALLIAIALHKIAGK